MTETINALLHILLWLAGPGAGLVASWLFALLRSTYPEAPSPTGGFRQFIHGLLWRSDRAVWIAPLMAVVLGGLAGWGAALLQAVGDGGDVGAAADRGLAALISAVFAFLVNQQAHKASTKQEPVP